jgi:hypothetical protein
MTSPEVVQKSADFLKSLESPACGGCKSGIKMCHHIPCMGTVEDMEKLMDYGYADKLMLDYWVGENSVKESMSKSLGSNPNDEPSKWNPFTEDIMYLVPAIKGLEGKAAPFARGGTCTLLVDNKCSVHHLDLKPVQGRFACCKQSRVFLDETGKKHDVDERINILHTWNTQKGLDLIERWKKEVNFTGSKTGLPETMGGMLEALLGTLTAKLQMAMPSEEENDLPFERQDLKYQEIVIEKPY